MIRLWFRTGLALVGGLAVGALVGSGCVLAGDECQCREPRPLVQGTFRVTAAASSSAAEENVAPVRTGTVTISEQAVVIDYVRGGEPMRARYTVASKHDLLQ